MNPEAAARILFDAALKGIYFPPELQGQLTVEEGYRTQHGMLALHRAAGEEQAGWKIGATAPAIRSLLNTKEPVAGYLLASRGFSSGLSFSFAELIAPNVEAELCFTLGRPLKGPGVTAAQAREAVAGMAPALEIVELRGNLAKDLGLGIADDVSQWGWVTGPELRPVPRDLVLGDVNMQLVRNGSVEVESVGRDVIDDQFESIAWLANKLATLGASLRAGQRVMAGSFNAPIAIQRGDRWEARFPGVGTVAARFD